MLRKHDAVAGWISAAILLAGTTTTSAVTDVIIVGGDEGLTWESGGGAIPATLIVSAKKVERTNAPGGVVDFDPSARPNWIFPKQADPSDNILIGFDSDARGGKVETPIPSFRYLESSFPNLYDNDGDTALEVIVESGAFGLIIQFDLGAVFGVNRLRFFPRNAAPDFPSRLFPNQRKFLKGFELFINDGAPESIRDEAFIWETIALEGQNDEPVVDVHIPTRFVRHIRLKSLTQAGFEMAEFQVFTEGFVPQALYVSNIFDFREKAILGNLRYIQEQAGDPQRSQVQIRTRLGIDPDPVEYTRIGVQTSGRVVRRGANFESVPIDVPWMKAEDVDDSRLSNLIETVLDNAENDGRESLLMYKSLSLEDREEITLDQDRYFDLENEERSSIRDDLTNWSPWSPPYPVEAVVEEGQLRESSMGAPIFAAEPRRYFQFRVEFSSEIFNAGSGVGELAIDASRPAFADSLVAEIFPRSSVSGEETDFTYAVRYTSKGLDAGFDRFHITTPLKVRDIGKVQIIGAGDSIEREADFTGVSLEQLPVSRGEVAVTEVTDEGFTLSFPRIGTSGTVLKVEFRSTVLRVWTRFSGEALNSDDLAFGQAAVAGNAADLSLQGLDDPDTEAIGTSIARNLFVDVPVVNARLINVSAGSGVFTPNGDGVNDIAAIEYDITNIGTPTHVEVAVFDLSGRRVRSFSQLRDSGRYTQTWDGRDEAGNMVPPGNYLYVVELEAGIGSEKKPGILSVAY